MSWIRAVCVLVGASGAGGCATRVVQEFDFAAQADDRARLGCPDEARDIDGRTYRTVAIAEQCWMADNLAVARHRDGTPVADSVVIDLERYGRQYRHASVISPLGLCPTGWRVPSDGDVRELEAAIGMTADDVGRTGWRGAGLSASLKHMEAARSWSSAERAAVNRTGLSLEPAGETIGPFTGADGKYLGLWTSSTASGSKAWARYLVWMPGHPRRDQIWRDAVNPKRGYSVRCVWGEG